MESGTSPDVLVDEARFILQKLLRDDLFGARVRFTEAERVLGSAALAVPFSDYIAFLGKFAYVRADGAANVIEVTDAGRGVAGRSDDPEFAIRVTRHFARELGTEMIRSVERPAAGTTRHDTRVVSRTPEPAPEEVIDRRYRRGRHLGSGPVGSVYEATHLGLGRPVAIKEAKTVFQAASYLKREEIVRRLRTAAQKSAGLVHPCIAQVIDQNHEREHPYVVEELAVGGSLRQKIATAPDKKLELRVALRALLQMAHALRYAHSQGVLHLGLKPENVLFDAFGNVKLVDFALFGVFERNEETGPGPMLLSTGAVGYFAPERLQPDARTQDLGPQADIYSVGIMIYEMLTGRLPGRRSPLPSQAQKEVPAAFDDVFDRMTRDSLEERYRSIDEMLKGIHSAFAPKDVFDEGTMLLWADDPSPKPKDPDVVEIDPDEIEAEVSVDSTIDEAHSAAADLKTGKVEVGAFRDLVESMVGRE